MKLGIVGSRTFTDYERMKREVDLTGVECIVSGGARGADTLASQLAAEFGIPLIEFKPDYESHGRAAPFVRNTQIVEASDVIIAFWDGKSTGTIDSVKKAEKMGKKVLMVEFNRVNLEF
jgi:hypothetical protein